MDENRFETTYSNLYDCYQTVIDMDSEKYEALRESEQYHLENMVELCKRFLKETEWVLAE